MELVHKKVITTGVVLSDLTQSGPYVAAGGSDTGEVPTEGDKLPEATGTSARVSVSHMYRVCFIECTNPN